MKTARRWYAGPLHGALMSGVSYAGVLLFLGVMRFRFGIPMYVVVGLLGAIVGLVVRVLMSRREDARIERALTGMLARSGYPVCERCGYDLRGSLSGHCPECGMSPTAAQERRLADGRDTRRTNQADITTND